MRAYIHGRVGGGGGGVGMTASQHNIFDSEKLSNFSRAPDVDGVQTSGLWIWSPTLYHLSHPVTFYSTVPSQ